MNFQDIHQYFSDPPPIYISKEVAVCYILSVLLNEGNSYGTALIQSVGTYNPQYRLSDTVLYSALNFLEEENVIQGYWQKVEGRGRPRRMYQILPDKLEQASSLSRLWSQYVGQSLPRPLESVKSS
ncbi:PadR family transcriptional regulator [Lyngbya confervoides]|uniref:PadR family transcriptional regulator n=1 Tax=Lyngbya confervoides BDU141951 TaxID=1574623 RepID=A0ABD4T272_9CYAN|nr:helix-turn-helix transcriptional regulator [Lyngbya confervoides]MCM1982672.1 PadR family transcriptional regulator [Lyngbya confervoides BDU141951]